MKNTLDEIRAQLDQIDGEIAALLNQRMQLAEMLAVYKQKHLLPIEDCLREDEVILKLIHAVQHPVLKEKIGGIYQKIMEAAKIVQSFQQVLNFPFKRVGIVGFGLIGGSIARALHVKDIKIEISCLTRENQEAKKSGIVDNEYLSLYELVLNSDLIILACPINAVETYAEEIMQLHKECKRRLVVIDVASVKEAITKRFENLTSGGIEFVATHPMAGSEKSGFENSEATLFAGAPWIISKHENNSQEGLRLIEEVIKFFGARPLFLDPKVHDRQTAIVSHIPGMLSKAILNFASEIDPECLSIAGSGFKSMTRLAYSNPQMRDDIFKLNRETILKYFPLFIDKLKKLN